MSDWCFVPFQRCEGAKLSLLLTDMRLCITDWAAVRGLFPLASMHFDENVYHMFAKYVVVRIQHVSPVRSIGAGISHLRPAATGT